MRSQVEMVDDEGEHYGGVEDDDDTLSVSNNSDLIIKVCLNEVLLLEWRKAKHGLKYLARSGILAGKCLCLSSFRRLKKGAVTPFELVLKEERNITSVHML